MRKHGNIKAEQRNSLIRNDRGMALLMTLMVMTILVTGALELNRQMRAAVIATADARDRLTLNQMAASAIHAGMALLVRDKTQGAVDSIQEDWANPEKIAELLGNIPFETGKVSLVISDEMAKIQVNALVDFPKGAHFNDSQKIMWDRFLRLMAESKEDDLPDDENIRPGAIINSIKDWLDSGDDDATTGLNGAESDYYQGLDPPCTPANGPFTHVDEVMQVKGVRDMLEAIGGQQNFGDYLTVYGMTRSQQTVDKKNFTFAGKININTADLPVLVALVPSENPEYAQSIFNYRNEKEDGEYIHDLSSTTWYKNAPDLPGDLTIDPKLYTTSSDFFRLTSTAELNDLKQTVTAVVYREQAKKTGKWTCKILSWYTE